MTLAGVVPPGDDALWRRIKALEDKVAALATARSAEATTIGKGGLNIVGAGGLDISGGGSLNIADDGDATIDGDLRVGGDMTLGGTETSANFVHGSTGFRLPGSGTPEFNDLLLRGGIIGNDALTNPVVVKVYYALADVYTIPFVSNVDTRHGSGTTFYSVTVTFPAGFTTASLFVTAADSGYNDGSTYDWLTSFILFSDDPEDFTWNSGADVPAGSAGASSVTTVAQFTGYSGGDTITVSSQPCTADHDWSSNSANSGQLAVLAIFTR